MDFTSKGQLSPTKTKNSKETVKFILRKKKTFQGIDGDWNIFRQGNIDTYSVTNQKMLKTNEVQYLIKYRFELKPQTNDLVLQSLNHPKHIIKIEFRQNMDFIQETKHRMKF